MAVRLATPHIPEDTPRVADGRYALLRRLGEGGMAVVYGAWDQDLQIWRAVKVLLPEFARRASVRRRFEREARTMMAIRHPHLVRVHEVRSERVLPYLVMDLVPGGSLEEWMLRYGPMPPRLAAAVGVEIAEGLIAVHEAGVVHRDVKPQNVLIDEDGLCRVTDFGVARVEGGDTRTGVSMGTLGYMAPEQFADSKTADARSDLYSLGATLFVLLTRRPVQEVMRLVDLPDGLAGLPGPLRPVLERCLAYERDERYPDGAALLADLIEARDALPPLGPEVPPLARTSTDNGLPGGSAGELTELQGLLDATHPPDEPDELASLVAPARSAVVQV
ncbi:MAG: serine/threonine-protein kinase, partial [Myxococcota bacterium]